MYNKFDKIVNGYLTESVSNGILERPLKKIELKRLNDGEDVIINITPDKYISKFTIAPYDNKEDMESMDKLHSLSMDGDFTFDIIDVDWAVDNIKLTLRAEGSEDEESDTVNSQFEDLLNNDDEKKEEL